MIKKKKIVLVNYGLANSFKDRIEINKELKNYPDLYNYVLDHELKHNDKAFSMSDIKHEFSLNKNILKLFIFILRRPKIWYELLPVYKKQNTIIHDNLICCFNNTYLSKYNCFLKNILKTCCSKPFSATF